MSLLEHRHEIQAQAKVDGMADRHAVNRLELKEEKYTQEKRKTDKGNDQQKQIPSETRVGPLKNARALMFCAVWNARTLTPTALQL